MTEADPEDRRKSQPASEQVAGCHPRIKFYVRIASDSETLRHGQGAVRVPQRRVATGYVSFANVIQPQAIKLNDRQDVAYKCAWWMWLTLATIVKLESKDFSSCHLELPGNNATITMKA